MNKGETKYLSLVHEQTLFVGCSIKVEVKCDYVCWRSECGYVCWRLECGCLLEVGVWLCLLETKVIAHMQSVGTRLA